MLHVERFDDFHFHGPLRCTGGGAGEEGKKPSSEENRRQARIKDSERSRAGGDCLK